MFRARMGSVEIAATALQESHRSHEYERLRWTHPEYALGALSRNIRYRGVMPPGGTPHDYAVARPPCVGRAWVNSRGSTRVGRLAWVHGRPFEMPATMDLWQDGKWRPKQRVSGLTPEPDDAEGRPKWRPKQTSPASSESPAEHAVQTVPSAPASGSIHRANPWLASSSSAASIAAHQGSTLASSERAEATMACTRAVASTPRPTSTPRTASTPRAREQHSSALHTPVPLFTAREQHSSALHTPVPLFTAREQHSSARGGSECSEMRAEMRAEMRSSMGRCELGAEMRAEMPPPPPLLPSPPSPTPSARYQPCTESRARYSWPPSPPPRPPPTTPPEAWQLKQAWAQEQARLGEAAFGSSPMLAARRKGARPMPTHVAHFHQLTPSRESLQLDYKWRGNPFPGGSANKNWPAAKDPRYDA